MRCDVCEREQENSQFLPIPLSTERQPTCVSCLLQRHQDFVAYLEAAAQSSTPDAYLRTASGPLQETGYSLTCLSETLQFLDELKTKLAQWGGRTLYRRKVGGQAEMEFRCLTGDSCSFRAWARELEDTTLQFQVIQPHSCFELDRARSFLAQENEAFAKLCKTLESQLPQEMLDELHHFPNGLEALKGSFKTLHDTVHHFEDEAIAHTWTGHCPWRRARGETNEAPGTEALNGLLHIAQTNGCGPDVEAYIRSNLGTEVTSSYFQQRGYLLLLTLAPEDDLLPMLQRRIQVLLYANKLIQQDLQLLSYRLLKPMVMRNHAWMVSLLWQALRHKQGQLTTYPLPGVTRPEDSNTPGLYDIIREQL